jgi:hypothetical protein
MAYNGKLPTTDQLAYLIGRKIELKGTEPTNALGNAMTHLQEKFALLDEAITKDLKDNVDVIFEKL